MGKIKGGTNGETRFVSGEHDAYRRLGVVHARSILLHPPDTWIVADFLRGRGSHRVESFLHFHPQVSVEAMPDVKEITSGLPVRCWTVSFAGRRYVLAAYGNGHFELRKSRYSEQFGSRQLSTALRWEWRGRIPMGMIQVLAPVDAPLPRIAADWSRGSIEISGSKFPLC